MSIEKRHISPDFCVERQIRILEYFTYSSGSNPPLASNAGVIYHFWVDTENIRT